MIISAAAANTPSALDPTLQILLTVFGAALVTALAGFAGAWLQGRREHARWVRERRYDAYVGAMQIAERWRHLRAKGNKIMTSGDLESPDSAKRQRALADLEVNIKDADSLTADVIDASAPLELLGPPSIVDAFNALTDAYASDEEDASTLASEAFIAAMRKTLKIEK